MEYTGGEWKIELHRLGGYNLEAGNKLIGSIDHLEGNNKEGFANAQLIALSPKMYEHIKVWAENGYIPAKRFMEKIAKAEGKC